MSNSVWWNSIARFGNGWVLLSFLCLVALAAGMASLVHSGGRPEAQPSRQATGWTDEERVRRQAELVYLRLTHRMEFGKLAIIPSYVRLREDPSYIRLLSSGALEKKLEDFDYASNWVDRKIGLIGVKAPERWWSRDYTDFFDALDQLGKKPIPTTRYKVPKQLGSWLKKGQRLARAMQDEERKELEAAARVPVFSNKFAPGVLLDEHLRLTPAQHQRFIAELLRAAPNDVRLQQWLKERLGHDVNISDPEVEAALNRLRPARGATGLTDWQTAMVRRHAALLRQTRQDVRQLSVQIKALDAKVTDEIQRRRQETERQKAELAYRQKIEEAQFVTSLVSNILRNAGGDAAKVGRALDVAANATFRVLTAASMTALKSVALPLAILSGLSDLCSLFGGGPDTNQIILEQLQELRKEVADFRQEVRVEFAYLRKDLFELSDKILDRIDAAEAALSRQIQEVNTEVRQTEARLSQIENLIIRNHQEVLDRFAELLKMDFQTGANRYSQRAPKLTDLTPASGQDVQREYDTFLSDFYTFAVDKSASTTLAGGDLTFPDVYAPNQKVALHPRFARNLIALVDDPRAPWQRLNDFAVLARSVETEMAPHDRLSDEIGWDPQALVNPLTWRLGASRFLDMAARSPKLFRSDSTSKRRLAEIYLRGEQVRDGLARLTSHPDRRVNRAVFNRLLQMQLSAIERFESTLKERAKDVAQELKVPLWQPGELELQSGWLHLERLNPSDELAQNRDRGWELPASDKLTFTAEEQKLLEETIPRPYRLARQLGLGTIEITYDESYFSDIRLEFSNWDTYEKRFGKCHLIVRALFHPSGRARAPLVIYRKLLKTHEEVFYAHSGLAWELYNANNPRHKPLDWSTEGRRVALRTFKVPVPQAPGYREAECAQVMLWHDGSPAPRNQQITQHWDEIKRQLLARGGIEQASPEQLAQSLKWVQQAANGLIIEKVLKLQLGAQGEVKGGFGELGEAVRQLYGTQLALLRFAELALPESLATDDRLFAGLIGEQAALNWDLLIEATKVGVVNDGSNNKPVEVLGLIRPQLVVPLATQMRARTEVLRTRLEEAVSRQAEAGPPRHGFLDEPLCRIVLVSRGLGVDLKAELRRLGARPEPHWMVESIEKELDNYRVLLEGRQ